MRRAVVPSASASLEEALGKLEVVAEAAGEAREPPSGRVELDVRACCVNFPDLLQTRGAYQHRQEFPYTPGLEVAGVVRRVARDSRLRAGDRVMAMVPKGGLATRLEVDEAACVPLPEALDFAQGAAFRMGFETAYHCLVERAQVRRGETILVTGATGGMGFAATQLAARVLGCTVIGAGGADDKLAVVQREGGASHVINYATSPEFSREVKRLTGGNGVDVLLDCVGGAVFDEGLRSTAFGARVLIVGFTSGSPSSLPTNYALIKCLTVLGCRAGEMPRRHPDGPQALLGPRHAALQRAAAKMPPHISHRFPLTTDGVRAAFRTLSERRVVGRVCVVREQEVAAPRL